MAKAAKTSRHTEPDANRDKALDQAVSQIERSFGKGSIMRLDDDPSNLPEGISTGSISLDLALGGRGIPRGRVVEVYGPESSGKTTLTLHTIAEVQKNGGVAAFIDAEHALDPVLGPPPRGQPRRTARLAARHRRAGPGNLRTARSAPTPSTSSSSTPWPP